MLVSDFDFPLPEALIAQQPPALRGASRMLRLDRGTGAVEDRAFTDLPELLTPGDLLVLNDSRVLPARLFATRAGLRTQAGSPAPEGVVEVLLTEQLAGPGNVWRALVKPAKKVPVGELLLFAPAPGVEPLLRAEVVGAGEFGERTLRFAPVEGFHAVLERIGHLPLPPYVRRPKAEPNTAGDRERYQTVYSVPFGSRGGETPIPLGDDNQKCKGEKQIPPLRYGMTSEGETQIPFGNDNQKGKGETQIPPLRYGMTSEGETPISFGNDNQKGKGEKQIPPLRYGMTSEGETPIPFGNDNKRGTVGAVSASLRGEGALLPEEDGALLRGEGALLPEEEGAQRVVGSAAAPTAGLHFTPEVLEGLAVRGVEVARLTLHVGLGTFQPVRVERTEEIRLHAEPYTLSEATAEALNRAWAEGRRVIAVGTTTTRTLEHLARQFEGRYGALGPGNPLRLEASSGSTGLFLSPGPEGDDRFRLIRGLLTNFHLPQSTLLMLVSAFAGRERVLAAYGHAVREGYRFFSYGDCMLVL